MSLVSSSARVVYAALAGDLAVAAAKFGASALSGSSAMLTEAIHSLVDSADQLLLLTGQSRARKPPGRGAGENKANGPVDQCVARADRRTGSFDQRVEEQANRRGGDRRIRH